MAFEDPRRVRAAEQTCQYQGSRLVFRGPKRDLGTAYIACLGGTETFGKCVERPFPDRLEAKIGATCVNLGWPNAGIDVLLKDQGLMSMARGARLTVLQVPNASNLTNRFYSVHPRRNDRFLEARGPLRRLYPEIDFTDFSFIRHMLATLKAHSLDRFALLHQELAQVWVEGMQEVIERIEGPVILLWFSDRSPDVLFDAPEMDYEPALVSKWMLEALAQDVCGIAYVPRVAAASGAAPVAGALPGQGAHDAAADALVPLVAQRLGHA